MNEVPDAFRRWSIIAFFIESAVVVAAYLFMVYFLKWTIGLPMMYTLVLVMVAAAALLIVTGRTAAGR